MTEDAPAKFRCTRCKRTRPVRERRRVEKSWEAGADRHLVTRVVVVCAACAGKKASVCNECGSMPHRVEGAACARCGLRAAPENVERSEPRASSPIAECVEA